MIDSSTKHIAILGSTGSIGTQALEVIQELNGPVKVHTLSAFSNVEVLIEQCHQFQPKYAIIGDPNLLGSLKNGLEDTDIQALEGQSGLCEAVQDDQVDMVLTALVGYAGLEPTLKAISAGKDIALANKETLVVAGELVMQLAKEHKVRILPVDSEHSAIFQCLQGENLATVEKIILTASGGPFRGRSRDELMSVTKHQALKHPNWDMGAKITIDSATLMNKGLEVIEAKWLFDLEPEQIDVIVHPQSIIHSMVQFNDGSIKAQMGLPDMKLPIQYAIGYPSRFTSGFERFSFTDYPTLTFEQPNKKVFKNLGLAYSALNKGGNTPCILNAANEVVVDAFLKEKIKFLEMGDILETSMTKIPYIPIPTLEDYRQTDKETRIKTLELIN